MNESISSREDDDDEEEEPGFVRRLGIPLVVLLVIAGIAIPLVMKFLHGSRPAPHKEQAISMVKLLPLPPPPPPPPPPPQQQQVINEEKMLDQQPVDSAPKTPDKAPEPPKPDAPAPGPLGTGIKGDGAPDGFGLAGSGNGGGGLLGGGGGGPGGGRFGWYAAKVQAKIADALRADPRTKGAGMRVEVRIWPDLTGRITRAKLKGSTGNPSVDQAIQNEVLTGLQLPEPPPDGMPTPIVLRLTALRPKLD